MMKPLLLLIIPVSILAQSQLIKDITIPLEFKNLNNQGALLLETDVTNKGNTLPFMLDLQSIETYIGIKQLSTGKNMSDFGLDKCEIADQCTLIASNSTIPNKSTYRGVQFDSLKGKVVVALAKGQKVAPRRDMIVQFITSNSSTWKFGKNNVLGLAPRSPFWSLVANSYQWPNKTVEVMFKMEVEKGKEAAAYSADAKAHGKLVFGNQVGSNNLTSAYFGLKQSTWELKASLLTPEIKPKHILRRVLAAEKVLIPSTKFCIAPNYPGFIITKAADAKLDQSIWKHICNKATPCPKTTVLGKPGELIIDFGPEIGKKNIHFSDLTYKGSENLEKGWITNPALFGTGGQCAGYSYAFGRNFFNDRFALLLKAQTIDVNKGNGWKIGVVHEGPPPYFNKKRLFSWALTSLIALLILVPIVCYCLTRSQKRGDLEQGLDEK